MDREDRLHSCKKWIAAVERFEIGGDQPGLPVVAVDNVWLPTEAFQGLQNTSTEEDKPLVIVCVVLVRVGVAIESAAVKQGLIIKKIDLDLCSCVREDTGFDAPFFDFLPDGDLNFLQPQDLVESELTLANAPVLRHDDTNFMPQILYGLRKSTGNIRQATGFCKRLDLT